MTNLCDIATEFIKLSIYIGSIQNTFKF